MADEYYEGDVRRAASKVAKILNGEADELLRTERDVHRAMRRLYWTVFQACFTAMCLWSVLDGIAKVVVRRFL